MTPAELRAYIEAQPEFADFIANGNDQQICDAINQRMVPVVGGVSRSRFAMWAGKTGIRATIQDHAGTQGSPLRAICLTLLDFLQGGVSESLDLSEPDNQQMLGIWVAMAEITQSQADDLIAMATTLQPMAGRILGNIDIARALGRG
jgi:type IV secretory pathway VirB2 component (pilin)